MRPFDPALEEMETLGKQHFGPVTFKSYLKSNGFGGKDTATYISVQSLEGLKKVSPELHEKQTMVFRLGTGQTGRGTQFALAKCIKGWDDYFFIDQSIFGTSPVVIHNPGSNFLDCLRIFEYLPRYTETTLVNLAIASGILTQALNLDTLSLPIVPATGQGTYTFSITPNKSIKVNWLHNNGQVEIDAVFIAQRAGQNTVFVVESKVSTRYESLAKHKLAYPLLALRNSIPHDLPIVGIYLRALKQGGRFVFSVAECCFGEGTTAISSMVPISKGTYVLDGIRYR